MNIRRKYKFRKWERLFIDNNFRILVSLSLLCINNEWKIPLLFSDWSLTTCASSNVDQMVSAADSRSVYYSRIHRSSVWNPHEHARHDSPSCSPPQQWSASHWPWDFAAQASLSNRSSILKICPRLLARPFSCRGRSSFDSLWKKVHNNVFNAYYMTFVNWMRDYVQVKLQWSSFLPCCKLSASLKTAACVCIVFCIVSLNSAVEIEPLAFLTQSKLATVSSPAF